MNLGEKILQARLVACLTQETLAKNAGISTTALRGIERGRIPSPRIFVVVALAEYLDLSLDMLLSGVPRPLKRTYHRQEEGAYGRTAAVA